MIRTYKAEIGIAVSMIPGEKDPEKIIRSFLEHLNGVSVHVDSIRLDPPDQEIPSSISQDDIARLL